MRVYLFNDTTGVHAGSDAVMRSLWGILDDHDVVAVHRVGQTTLDAKALAKCDVVLVNGEGTIHHRAPAGDFLMHALESAQNLEKRTLLVNALFQQEPPYFPQVLKRLDYLSVREPWSETCARKCGGNPTLLLDSCADQELGCGSPVSAMAPMVKGETHPESPCHGILDRVELPQFRLGGRFEDCVASLGQCRLYITGQHHGVYAAGLAGIPFVAVPSNSHKIESLIAWSGLPIPICRTETEVQDQIERALAQPELFDRFREFLLTQQVFGRADFDRVLACNEWQTSRMVPRPQPAMIRAYDDKRPGRKLIGSTTFFRNRPLLRAVLAQIDAMREHYTVLFHAASIGCDPYSFCIAYDLFFEDRPHPQLHCYATDVCAEFLRVAQRGVYDEDVLQGVSKREREYFERVNDRRVCVRPTIRERVTFLPPHSFVDYRSHDQFDAVFLLDALRYVPAAAQAATLDAIAQYNRELLVITGFHSNQIREDLTRNEYRPVADDLEIIHNHWTCRRTLDPGCVIAGVTYSSPALEELSLCDDYEYRFGAIFAKAQAPAHGRHTQGIARCTFHEIWGDLGDPPLDFASARLAHVVHRRPVAIMLHGSSIKELQERIEEFQDLDLCYCSVNLFSVMESRILSKIRKELAFVFCSSEDELLRRLPDITEFLGRSPDKLLITTCEAVQGLGHFVTSYWRQILFVEKPRRVLPGRMPNSLTVLLHTLVRARVASEILLFGADGCVSNQGRGQIAQTYFGKEILIEENRSWQLARDTELFNQTFTESLEEIYRRDDAPRVTIRNCSPRSVLTPFPRIDYGTLRAHIARGVSGVPAGGARPRLAVEEVEEQRQFVDRFLASPVAWNPRRMTIARNGFGISYWRGSFYAFPLGERIDMTKCMDAHDAESRAKSKGYRAETLAAVEAQIDDQHSTQTPELLEEDYKGFNIVRYRRGYFAFARRLGSFDLASADSEWLREQQERGACVIAHSRAGVKLRLDGLAAEGALAPSETIDTDLTDPPTSNPGVATSRLFQHTARSAITVAARGEAVGSTPDEQAIPFMCGNYVGAILEGRPNAWQTYAALGLIGNTEAALEGLRRFDAPEARFYAAVTCWIAGDESTASRILEEIPTAHARKLLSLIRKPQIHVLAQLPWTRKGPQDLLGGAEEDGRFVVRNISFESGDLQNEPYADIRRYVDPRTPPDFYVCAMAEWHLIPPNLQTLPCPILGQTADYDLHIQTVYPWLQVFDGMVVTDHTEWADVSRLTRVPVCTFPKSFLLPDRLPPIPRGPRRYDLLQTGTVAHPYYPDKGELLHQILSVPTSRVLCVNGFLEDEAYRTLLADSKIVPTYVRHSGAMPTRGLEALSMGCVVTAQRDSALTLFAGADEGVLAYDLNQEDIASVITKVLRAWPEYQHRARRGAGIVRREFGKARVASQYLRFLTFLAAKPRGQRHPVPVGTLDQRRRILWKGWNPGNREVLQLVQERTLAHLRARAEEAPTPRILNDMARELVLIHAVESRDAMDSPVAEEAVSQILAFYRAAVERYPRSLVLRFNLVRTALHFGRPNEVSEALRLTVDTLRTPSDAWNVDALDDVFPWDFASTFFNYRSYFDAVTEHLASETAVTEDLVRLILASLHYYAAHYSQRVDHYATATTLDPRFPFYQLRYAHVLLQAGDAVSRGEAKRLLWHLARHTILFVDACAMLEKVLTEEGSEDAVGALNAIRDRAAESIKMAEDLRTFPLRPALVQLREAPFAEGADSVAVVSQDRAGGEPGAARIARAAGHDYLVSALVTTYCGERFMRGLLEDLERQTVAERLEIVIVDSASPENERRIVEAFRRSYDNIVYLRTDERENSHVALNRAIRMARGRYLTLANADDRHRRDAFERMAAVLESQPGVALVYADSAITDQENEILESAQSIGNLRLPQFDHRRLFRGCCVGPQPMWRRELHDKYGVFDPEFEICGDYEFWLRTGVRETFHHIPEVLGLYFMSPTSNERVNRIRRHQETERARRKHWPAAWGELPPWDADYNVMNNTNTKAPLGEPPSPTADSCSAPAGVLDGLEVGQDALERNAWAEACDGFIRALEQDPACGVARSGLGLALMALGDAEEGLAQLQESVRLSPTPDAVCNLACGLIHVGRHADARQLLEGILAIIPTHQAARANLDVLSGVAEDSRTSEPCSDSPNAQLSAMLESAAGHLANKRWPEAVTGFRAVLRQAPDLAEARAALGSALLVIGHTEEAIPELRTVADTLDTSRAWNDLGWACTVAGQMDVGRAAFVTAIERDPANLEPQRNLAALFEMLHMPQEAAAAYELILLTAPGDPEAGKGKIRCADVVAASRPVMGVPREMAVAHG